MRSTQRGFTLAEVMLVLVVAAVMLGGATLLYGQLRDNASTADAQAKVSAMQGLIETYVAGHPGTTPTGQWVADQWAASRKNDFDTSPWGGAANCVGLSPVPCETTNAGATSVGLRYLPEDPAGQGASVGGPGISVVGDNGVLVYTQLVGTGVYKPFGIGASIGEYDYVSTYDNALKQYVYTGQYSVSIEDSSGNQFYFVRGPAYCPGGNCAPPNISSNPVFGVVGGGTFNQ